MSTKTFDIHAEKRATPSLICVSKLKGYHRHRPPTQGSPSNDEAISIPYPNKCAKNDHDSRRTMYKTLKNNVL